MSFSLTGVSDFMYPVSSVFKYNENRYSPTITTNHDIINNFRWSDTNRPWITSPVITYENDEIIRAWNAAKLKKTLPPQDGDFLH